MVPGVAHHYVLIVECATAPREREERVSAVAVTVAGTARVPRDRGHVRNLVHSLCVTIAGNDGRKTRGLPWKTQL